MKNWKLIKPILFFFVFFVFLIPKVYALAGFAEFDSTLHYNQYADIYWGHPTDGCDSGYPYGQFCFRLLEKNELAQPLNEDLRQISIPPAPDFPMALIDSGHSKYFGKGIWVIYDFQSRGNIFETEDFETALGEWKKLGYQEPKFADAYNLSNYFLETKESKAENNKDFFTIYLPIFLIGFFLVPILVHWKFFTALFLLAAIVIFYVRNRKKFYT